MSSELRILHTSDVHLWDNAADDVRMRGWQAVLGLTTGADLLLVAGDLLDHARVSQGLLDRVLEDLSSVRIPVVLLPGNHDLSGPGSVQERLNATQAGPHIVSLDAPEGSCVQVPGLDVTVWGRGMTDHTPENRPLAGHAGPSGGRWHLVLAHGHLLSGENPDLRSSPIDEAEVAALDADYLALGHWHRYHEVSSGTVAGGYSGPPSAGWPGGPASVNQVTLGRGARAIIDRIPLGPAG
jgi:DNA repair exonuclease SbcCD nuclease subunit